MKYLLLLSAILLLNSCDDLLVRNNAAHFALVQGQAYSAASLVNTTIGDKEYGFVEMDLTIATPLTVGSSFGVYLRAQSSDQYYTCVIGADNATSKMKAMITANLPGSNNFTGSSLVTGNTIASFTGDHVFGCELALVGTNKTIRLYLDDVLITSYVLGSNLLDIGGASTGKVGLTALTSAPVGNPPENGVVITDFKFYDVKP